MICEFRIKQDFEKSGLPSAIFSHQSDFVLRFDLQLCIFKENRRAELLTQALDRDEVVSVLFVRIIKKMPWNARKRNLLFKVFSWVFGFSLDSKFFTEVFFQTFFFGGFFGLLVELGEVIIAKFSDFFIRKIWMKRLDGFNDFGKLHHLRMKINEFKCMESSPLFQVQYQKCHIFRFFPISFIEVFIFFMNEDEQITHNDT